MNIGLPERRAALRAAQYEGCQLTLALAACFCGRFRVGGVARR